jgi:anthranilate phosphoribosyltransferase
MSSTPVRAALEVITSGRLLGHREARAAFDDLLDGRATAVETAALLTGLRLGQETAEVLAAAVQSVRERMIPLALPSDLRPVIDTCGTGGDGAATVNISTAAAITAAACGLRVVKHGNRSASGRSGSAEVLERWGVRTELDPEQAIESLRGLGIAFLFAPRYHPGLRTVAPVRKALPFRTIFNLVGPLVNPASPEYQLIGCSDARHARVMAEALGTMGVRRAVVVHGRDGLDEITLSGPTDVIWVEPGSGTRAEVWTPDDFGIRSSESGALHAEDPAASAAGIGAAFAGEAGPVADVIVANAAVALHVAGAADTLRDGVARAREALKSGGCRALLERWVAWSGMLG